MREVQLAAALAVLAGCASGNAASVPDAAGVDALPPDAASPDATLEARSFTDDTAADFSFDALGEAVVEPWGAIAPVAYYTGGLLVRASDSSTFTTSATATWAGVTAFTPTGKDAITWLSSVDWGSSLPQAMGLTSGDTFTTWLEGEIWLEQGDWTFSYYADDHGFLEIAPPGSAAFSRLISTDFPSTGSGALTAPNAGWYPIRFAQSEQSGGAGYELKFQGPGMGALTTIPRERFRARVDRVAGLAQVGFDDPGGTGAFATTVDAVGPANSNWGGGNPGDLGMTAAETFSVRWTGQVRIDVAGTYTFRYQADDGQRLWIDGIKWVDVYGDNATNSVTAPIALDAGWHDLVVEQTEAGGSAMAAVTVESGPDGVGQPLPVARLRPVEARFDRISAGGVNHTDVAIPDNNSTGVSSSVSVSAPAGVTVTTVDVSFQFVHPSKSDMSFVLKAPNGTEVQIVDFNVAGNGTFHEHATVTGFTATPAAGTWTVIAKDLNSSNTGTLLDVGVTPHWAGGDPPIPLTAWFESDVRDLGASLEAVDAVRWAARAATGATIGVRLRTCVQAAGCAAEPWSDPITTSGGTVDVPAGRYLQYRVELTTDGDHAPAVESLTVDYHVAVVP